MRSGLQEFEVLPGGTHPRDAAMLGMLEEGCASGQLGSRGEGGVAVTAPHFQVLDQRQEEVQRNPASTDSVLWRGKVHRLQLGTGLALSQLGLGGKEWDLAAGVAVTSQSAEAEKGHAWRQAPEDGTVIEPSLRLRLGEWQCGTALRNQGELALSVGKVRKEIAMQWGVELGLPTRDGGEVMARTALRKGFSDAFGFSVGGSTSYRKRPDATGKESFQRQSLGVQVGTSLRFRPWVEDRDPEWLQTLVDPLRGTTVASWLWDWEVGLQTRWDAIDADTRTSVTLSRWF
jgi:hypothetical protein